eukprot:TRINITY_DN5276_c0_g1_i1.p1 TRINITY_DN5276_c0_g1~~TRINITY_DN5276_c0_g1_i1.p1  ORF type:complete len:221 (-),score=43.90 TRINITY_DN5276_c0_g1_i1:170-832(-)
MGQETSKAEEKRSVGGSLPYTVVSQAKGGASNQTHGTATQIRSSRPASNSASAHVPGVITVHSEVSRDTIDPDLALLQQLPTARPLIKSSVDGGWNFKDIFSSPKSEQLDKLDPRPVMILINEYQIFCRKWSNQVSRNQKSLAVKMKEVEFASTKVRDTVHMQTNDMRVFANQFREVEKLRQQMDELNQIVRRVLQQTEQLRLLLPEQDRPASFQDTIAN